MKTLDWLIENFNVPNVLLTSLLLLGLVVLVSALNLSNFRLGDMIIDERGKASSSRIAMFIALGLSSYMLAYLTINKKVDDDTLFYIYAVYLITWAGSKTLDKLVSAWSFSKGYGSSSDEHSARNRRFSEERRGGYSRDGYSPLQRNTPDIDPDPVPYMRSK
jgi:hypothetical protein